MVILSHWSQKGRKKKHYMSENKKFNHFIPIRMTTIKKKNKENSRY